MLLTGTYARTIEEKQRVTIPKPLRLALELGAGSALYVAPGTDLSLAIYPEKAFSQLAERLAQASPTASDVRDFTRMFYARASRVEPDRQARVRIPQDLVDLAGLKKNVVLAGVGDHMELWDADRWEKYLEEKLARYDDIAEAAFGRPPQTAPTDRLAAPGARATNPK